MFRDRIWGKNMGPAPVVVAVALVLSSSKDDQPAMSIALSPSGFFASQRVSVSAPNRQESSRLLANSLSKSIEKHSILFLNQPRIDPRRRPGAPKIDSKSLPGPPRETPCRARASRRRLGSVPERPRRPPGGPGESSRATRHARKDALERLGARRGDQNRRQVASEK